MSGGREIEDKAIRKNEEETNQVSEEARKTKEAVERERRISMFLLRSGFISVLASYLTKMCFYVAELSPPRGTV
jgi:hypothetical protein